MDVDEKDLIARVQQGDERAFEALLRHHYDRIFAMAYSICLNRDRAMDATQNACFAIARDLHRFRHQSSFLTWAYRITHNVASNAAKSERRRAYHEGRHAQENGHSFDPSASEIHEHRQALQILLHLPEALRKTVLLVHHEGMTHKQAATALGCAEMTVSWRLHKARKLRMEAKR